ncbi:MAG: ABC transporter substrate-binding protein [Alphaproteobacteria bacterium]|nr:ABC transporter substrate-binding protein [Alphaproteobacteria bacterium]
MALRILRAALGAAASLALAVTTAPAHAQKRGGDLVILQQSTPITLDAITSTEQAVRNVTMHLFEMLVTRDEGANPIPDLAAKIDESADGLTYTFTLRQGVKFHNGKEMTSADAKASVERYGRIGFDRADFAKIKSVAAPDKHTLTITLTDRVPSFIEQLSSPRAPMVIIPAEEAAKEANKIAPIGTGPFQLVDYVPDSHVKMKRFEDYKANEGAGERNGFSGRKVVHVDTVTFRIVPEANARVAAMETRVGHFSESVPNQTAKRLKDSKDIQIVTLMPWSMAFAIINSGPGGGATAKLGVRRAIQAAIDAEEVMTVSTDGVYRLDHAFNYPESQYFSADVGKAVYNQASPAKAKQLLAEAGYAREEIVIITTSQIALVKAQAEVTAEQLKAAGMNVRVAVFDTPGYIARAGQPEGWNIYIGEFGLAPSIGPYGLPNFWTGPKNWQKLLDPALETAFDELKSKPTLAERKAAADRFYARVTDQAYAVKLGDNGLLQAVRNEVKNFKPYRVPRAWGVWLE